MLVQIFGWEKVIMLWVTIGERVIIQAGSCIVNDIPELLIAGGHPAKIFKKRNPEHYFEKKNNGQFF